MSKTRMTVGQAIVKFLNQQYIEMDGKEEHPTSGSLHPSVLRHSKRTDG